MVTQMRFQHLEYAPERGDLDAWLAGMEQLVAQLRLPGLP
jgi:hypothetical protein